MFIPSQKLNSTRPLSEDKKVIGLKLEHIDNEKLRSVFSVSSSLSDAEKLSTGELLTVEQSADTKLLSLSSEAIVTALRIRSLNIPPLTPDFGSLCQPDGRPFSMYTEALDMGPLYEHGGPRSQWRPRENVLVATLNEHKAAVNRLAISRDQSFFASASADKTVKVCIFQLPSTFECSHNFNTLTSIADLAT